MSERIRVQASFRLNRCCFKYGEGTYQHRRAINTHATQRTQRIGYVLCCHGVCQLVCVVAVVGCVLVVVVGVGVAVAVLVCGVGVCVAVVSGVVDVVAAPAVVDRCVRVQHASLEQVHRLPDHSVIFRVATGVNTCTCSSQVSFKSVLFSIRRVRLPTTLRYQHACDTTDTTYWLRPVLP